MNGTFQHKKKRFSHITFDIQDEMFAYYSASYDNALDFLAGFFTDVLETVVSGGTYGFRKPKPRIPFIRSSKHSFDKGLLSFKNDGTILLSNDILELMKKMPEDINNLLKIPEAQWDKDNAPGDEYLEYHREQIFLG